MVRIKQIVSIFFFVLFISYLAVTTLFSHTHTISGATVFHSHLHTDSHHDTKSGGHTQNEITLIAQVSHFEFANFSSCFTLAPQQFQLFENKTIEEPYRVVSIHFQNLSLRAPPIL
jgi:hypothetical protein